MSDKPGEFVNAEGSGTIKLLAGSIDGVADVTGTATVSRVESDILRRMYKDKGDFRLAAEQWLTDQRNHEESERWVIDAVIDHLSKTVNKANKYPTVVDLLYKLNAVGRMRAWRNCNGGLWDWEKMAIDLNVIKKRTGKPVPGKTLAHWWKQYHQYLDDPPRA